LPEWPDLAVVRRRLEVALAGQRIAQATELQPLVLRLPVAGPLERLAAGRVLAAVDLRGKFLGLRLDDGGQLVINPMLTGLLYLARRRDAAVRLQLDGGACLDYVDPKRMGKVYYLPPGMSRDAAVPGYAGMGPDAPLVDVSPEEFARRGRRRRCEVRNLLLDPTFVAGIGNAYADEILWAARLHPKRPVPSLQQAEWDELYAAVREVLGAAERQVEAQLPPSLGPKIRSHMQVRGRAGESCPRCGARIVRRHLGYLETDFCPRCQPDPSGHFPLPEPGRGW
jgi:formamidopyrimidine-DNA glycosylase